MQYSKLFLDTSYILALLDKNDQYHEKALKLFSNINTTKEIWFHEGILIEIGDGLSEINRDAAFKFYKSVEQTKNFNNYKISSELISEAYDFYYQYKDKDWGLTDCISFCVMKKHDISDALTSDHHFEQAGFSALLNEDYEKQPKKKRKNK